MSKSCISDELTRMIHHRYSSIGAYITYSSACFMPFIVPKLSLSFFTSTLLAP